MTLLSISNGHLGAEETVEVHGPDVEAVVSRRGATLLRWRVRRADGSWLDLVDGYRSESELAALAGVRSGVMAPFVNRVAGARYSWDGDQQDLMPGHPDGDRLIYHGLLYGQPYEGISTDSNGDGARIAFTSQAIRPGKFAGYPYALDVEVIYQIGPTDLRLEVRTRNVGDRVAPYATGWHPYFSVGGQLVDGWELTVPARTVIQVDADLIPLPGQDAFGPIESRADVDYRVPRTIGTAVLDVCFADLQPAPDGRLVTRLVNPESGAALEIWQDRGLMHVFTADTLPERRRASIALEPVEIMANAYNRGDCRSALELPAGQLRSFVCGVSLL